jgi:hypothetical protein
MTSPPAVPKAGDDCGGVCVIGVVVVATAGPFIGVDEASASGCWVAEEVVVGICGADENDEVAAGVVGC